MQVGNGIEVARCLFLSETAIQITPDGAMPRGTCELADMIDVISRILDFHQLWISLTSLPSRIEHPSVERCPDDGISRNKQFNLFVSKLTFPRHQCAAIVMARNHWSVVDIH